MRFTKYSSVLIARYTMRNATLLYANGVRRPSVCRERATAGCFVCEFFFLNSNFLSYWPRNLASIPTPSKRAWMFTLFSGIHQMAALKLYARWQLRWILAFHCNLLLIMQQSAMVYRRLRSRRNNRIASAVCTRYGLGETVGDLQMIGLIVRPIDRLSPCFEGRRPVL